MKKKIIPVFFIIIVGILMFWDKGENFLTPNTFNNIGDTAFPLNIDYANSFLYAWDKRADFGLGQVNLCPTVFPMYLFVLLWSVLGLPLWIANRLWHILPNILIGVGAFYLYGSLFKSKYSWVYGTIASTFIMLLPDRNIFPHGSLGFAGTLLMMGAFIRGLFSEYTGSSKRNAVIMFSFGIVMAIHYIRCLYITLIIIILITVLTFYFNRGRKQSHNPILKFISFSLFLALLLNLFWIVPLFLQLTQGKSSLFPASKILEQRETFYKVHQKMTNPAYILRATTGGSGTGRPSHYYFSYPLILPFSFLIPLYCFLPLLLRNVNKKIKLLIFSSLFLSLYPFSFHISPAINLFSRRYIPTFWIMNDPTYWLLYVGVCYGLIIGAITEHFAGLIKDRNRKVAFVSCISFVVIIFGGGVLFDRALLPGFVNRYSLFGNKFPYVKIPQDYEELERYLSTTARTGNRIWYIDTGNYKRYTWYYKGHQPEILFFKSPIPAVGRPLTYATPMIDLLSESIDFRKNVYDSSLKVTSFLGKIMNLRYLLIHKDYFYEQDILLNTYLRRNITKSNNFKVVMDTDKFILYENKDSDFNQIYTLNSATFIVGDFDSIKFIPHTESWNIERSILLFSEQNQNERPKIRNVSNFIFNDSNWYDLAVELSAQSTVHSPQSTVSLERLGVYEIYLDTENIKDIEEIPEFRVEVDGKEIALGDWAIRRLGIGYGEIGELKRKYVKVGEVELEEGKHILEVIRVSGYPGIRLSEDPKIKDENIKLVLVSKEERLNAEKLIWQRINEPETEVAYIFSRDGEFYVP